MNDKEMDVHLIDPRNDLYTMCAELIREPAIPLRVITIDEASSPEGRYFSCPSCLEMLK